MAVSELLRLVVEADVDGAVKGVTKIGTTADKELSKAEQRIDKVGAGFRKAGAVMLTAGGVMAAGMLKSVGAASDLEQAVGGTEAVFGDVSDTIDQFAADSAKNMGLSEREFREATTSIGGQLKRMTGDVDYAAERSVELTGVAADLAATYGGTTAEAVQALGAAFRGEADPAERFNLNLKIGAVNAKAVELGLAATEQSVSEAARAQATYALIMEQSSDAQGQFAREQDTMAGSTQIARAEFENAQAALGEGLAPIMADAAGFAADLATKFSDLNTATGGMASQVAVGVTGLLLLGGAISTGVGYAIQFRDTLKGMGPTMRRTAGGLAALTAAVYIGTEAWNDYNKGTRQADEQMDQITQAFRSTESDVEALAQALDAMGVAEEVSELLNDAGISAEAFATALASGDVEQYRGALEDAAASADDLSLETLVMIDNLDEVAGGFAEAKGASDEVDEAFGGTEAAAGGVADAMVDVTDETESYADAIAEVDDALRAQFDPLFAAQDATADLAQAQLEAAAAVKEHGEESIEAAAAHSEVTRAAADFESAMLELQEAVEDGDTSLDDARTTLQRWVDQGLITEEQAGLTADSFDWLSERAKVVPKDVSTTVNAPGLDDAVFKMASLIGLARDANQAVVNFGGGRVQLDSSGRIVGLHAGGRADAGSTYLVGEEGPELLTMGARGGFVTSNESARKLASGGGTNVFNIYNPVAEPASESIYKAARRFASGVGV